MPEAFVKIYLEIVGVLALLGAIVYLGYQAGKNSNGGKKPK